MRKSVVRTLFLLALVALIASAVFAETPKMLPYITSLAADGVGVMVLAASRASSPPRPMPLRSMTITTPISAELYPRLTPWFTRLTTRPAQLACLPAALRRPLRPPVPAPRPTPTPRLFLRPGTATTWGMAARQRQPTSTQFADLPITTAIFTSRIPPATTSARSAFPTPQPPDERMCTNSSR